MSRRRSNKKSNRRLATRGATRGATRDQIAKIAKKYNLSTSGSRNRLADLLAATRSRYMTKTEKKLIEPFLSNNKNKKIFLRTFNNRRSRRRVSRKRVSRKRLSRKRVSRKRVSRTSKRRTPRHLNYSSAELIHPDDLRSWWGNCVYCGNNTQQIHPVSKLYCCQPGSQCASGDTAMKLDYQGDHASRLHKTRAWQELTQTPAKYRKGQDHGFGIRRKAHNIVKKLKSGLLHLSDLNEDVSATMVDVYGKEWVQLTGVMPKVESRDRSRSPSPLITPRSAGGYCTIQ